MQLYDDNRKNLKSANEAEFRAFCIIFQIQDPVPDLEDRVQTWPEEVLNDGRIKRALAIYAAACNTSDAQGPLKPRATHPIARANWRRFWQIVQSSEISYCMACVAEIYFPLIRRITLNAIWRSFRAGGSAKSEDWSLSELVDVFGMDNQQDAAQFCKEHGFVFSMRQDGAAFLDLTSVTGKHLPEPTRRIGQLKSLVVERKRYNRALSAVINGMTVRAAEEAGLIEQPQANEDQDMSEEDSLFVPENSTTKSSFEAQTPVVNTVIDNSKLNPFASAFSPSCAVSSLKSGSQSDTSAAVSTSQPEGHKKAIAISNDDTPDTAKASGSLLGAYNSGETSRTMMQSSSPFGFGQIHPASTSTAAFGAPSTTLNNVASLYQPEHPASNTKELDSAPAQSSPFNFNTNKPYFSNTPNSSPFTFGSSFSASGIHSNLQKTNPFASTTATSPANLPTDSTPASSMPPVPYSPGGFTFPSSISRAPAISSFPPATSSLPKSPNSDPSRFPDFSIPSVAVQASTSPFSYTPTTQLAPSSAVNHTLAASATHTSQTHVGTTHDPEHDIASAGAVSGPSTSLPSARNEASVPVSEAGRSSLNANNSTTPQRVAVTKMQRSRILRDLSQKLLLDPGGYLEQYVEYFTNPIITRIQEDIAAQRLCEEAGKSSPIPFQICRAYRTIDEHRVSRLSFRYGTRWRDITWNRRVLRKGKERRARLARDVLKKSTNTIAPGEDEVTTFVSSLNRRVRPSVRRGRDGYAEEDNDVESLKDGNGDSRDEASPRGKDTRATERARQAELQSSRRSSIASETSRYSMNVLPSAARHDTTRSTYFKMKALGLDPNAGQPAKPLAQSMKRIRSNDDFDAVVDKRRFSPSPSSPPPLRSSKELSGPSLHRTPSDEDAELFAAIRAARDAMSESISFFKEEMAKDELNRSRSSEGLNDSIRTANPPPPPRFDHSTASTPTLSMGSATLGKEPPPKYRNRVSKFLPRELYADMLLERQRRANVNANGVANGVAIKPTAAARTSIRERMGIGTARTPLRRQASPPPKTTAPPAVQPNVHAPVGAQRRANPFAALSEGGTAAHDEDDEDAGADGGGERVEHDEAAHPKFEDHSDDNAADFAGDEALNGREGPDDMGEWDEEDGEEGCEEEGVGEPSEDEYSDDDEGEYDDNDDDDSQAGYTDEEYPASTAAVVAAPPSRLVDGKSGASVDDAIEL